METSDGNRRSHTYDVHGRTTSTTVRTDATDRTFTHGYNSDARLDTLGYPSGYQVTYEYSSDLRALSALREASTSNLIWRADERNANGQTLQTNLDGVVDIARQFDPLTGLVSDIQAGPSATPTTLVDVSYGYDVLGNLTSRYDARMESAKKTIHTPNLIFWVLVSMLGPFRTSREIPSQDSILVAETRLSG